MSLTTPTLQIRIQISVFQMQEPLAFKKLDSEADNYSCDWLQMQKPLHWYQIWLFFYILSNMNYMQRLWPGTALIYSKNLQPWREKNLLRTQEIWAHFRLVSTEQLIVITAERQGHGEWAQNIRHNEITGQWGTMLLGDGTGQVRLRWAHRFTWLKNKSKGMLVLGNITPGFLHHPPPPPAAGIFLLISLVFQNECHYCWYCCCPVLGIIH